MASNLIVDNITTSGGDTFAKSLLKTGKNLFNISDSGCEFGKYINFSTGNLQSNVMYNTTYYIPVTADVTYSVSYKHTLAWYDVDKVFISASPSTDAGFTHTAPANAAFLRCGVLNTGLSWTYFCVEVGSTRTGFTPYDVYTELSSTTRVPFNNVVESIPPSYNLHTLRETRKRLREIQVGIARQHSIACIGDSWTHATTRYMGTLYTQLQGIYGDAGLGYISFAAYATLKNQSVDSACTVTKNGSWDITTNYYNNQITADLGLAYTSVTGDTIVVSVPEGQNTMTLHYLGGGGVVKYKYDSGSYTTVDTSAGSGFLTINMGTPPTSTAFTITFEVVSGSVYLAGIDSRKTSSGVIVNKLGCTGSKAAQWAAVDSITLPLASLAPNLITILLGVNDISTTNATAYKTYIETSIVRIKTSLPTADILLIAPCDTGVVSVYSPMSNYRKALYDLSKTYKVGFINLQAFFGDVYSDYGYGSIREWFESDNIHPTTGGGKVILDAIIRAMLSSI